MFPADCFGIFRLYQRPFIYAIKPVEKQGRIFDITALLCWGTKFTLRYPSDFLSETVPGNVLNYSANAQMHPCAPAREIRVLVLLRSSDARRRVPT